MIGVLLINLGTPAAPTEIAVKQYLQEFLSDPHVITLPKILRDFLVQKIILRKRLITTTYAYQQIWTPQGSPLLVNSIALQQALQKKLGEQYIVMLGMRYGHPNIADGLKKLNESCEKIIVLPLFPQFAYATTQSALDVVATIPLSTTLHIISDFYNHPAYISALTKKITLSQQKNPSDFLLMSFHGLPKHAPFATRYHQQCLTTAHLLANQLSLADHQMAVSFQSRLGIAKWLTPYTHHIIQALRKKNIGNLSVVCPSFVADCIETAEEINIRLRAQWQKLGGKQFHFIACLNAEDFWVDALATHFIIT